MRFKLFFDKLSHDVEQINLKYILFNLFLVVFFFFHWFLNVCCGGDAADSTFGDKVPGGGGLASHLRRTYAHQGASLFSALCQFLICLLRLLLLALPCVLVAFILLLELPFIHIYLWFASNIFNNWFIHGLFKGTTYCTCVGATTCTVYCYISVFWCSFFCCNCLSSWRIKDVYI